MMSSLAYATEESGTLAVSVSPIDGAEVPRSSFQLTWSATSGATQYGIELLSAPPEIKNGTTASKYRIAAALTGGSAASFAGDGSGLAPGVYWWRTIPVVNGSLAGSFSNAHYFNVPPPELMLTSPAAGATLGVIGPIRFTWQPLPGATSYGIELLNAPPEIEYNREPSTHRIAADQTAGVVYQGSTAGLAPGVYYWRVIGVNAAGLYGKFSHSRSFIVPVRPALTSPANGYGQTSTGRLDFDWSDIPGATAYGIELLSALPENPNGTTPSIYRVAAVAAASSSYLGDTTGMSPGTYYWRVIAAGHSGYLGVFSDARSFTVPAEPALTSPAAGYTQSGKGEISFNWQPVYGADGYAIELLSAPPESPNGTAPSKYRLSAAIIPSAATTFIGDSSGLIKGTYYWRIIAIRKGQLYGVFSDARSFTVPAAVYPPLGNLTYSLLGDYSPGERSDHGTGYGTPGSKPGHNVWIDYGDAYDFMCGAGIPVYASHSGTVIERGTGSGGYTILLGQGYETVYGHVTPNQQVGDYVQAGQLIGYTETSYAHLHYELWHNGSPVLAGDIAAYF